MHYVNWAIRNFILKEKTPLNCSLVLTDECNLYCKHCTVAHLGYPQRTLNDIRKDLEILYATGARVLVITGGEPFIWADINGNTVENIVIIARQMGFFRIVICTNGTYLLKSTADYLWVSLDGFKADHDSIRGSAYNKVIENIQNSDHKGIYINFTISSINASSFQNAARHILDIKNVKGILFHLYTNYISGNESLMLDTYTRAKVLNDLLVFKKKHPIAVFNTFCGINALIKNNWERRTYASVTINQGVLSECCCRTGIYNEKVCRDCGCSPAVETWVLQKLKLSAIIENLRYL